MFQIPLHFLIDLFYLYDFLRRGLIVYISSIRILPSSL